jgi:hypothetical protein
MTILRKSPDNETDHHGAGPSYNYGPGAGGSDNILDPLGPDLIGIYFYHHFQTLPNGMPNNTAIRTVAMNLGLSPTESPMMAANDANITTAATIEITCTTSIY